jgi:hypothetical protein
LNFKLHPQLSLKPAAKEPKERAGASPRASTLLISPPFFSFHVAHLAAFCPSPSPVKHLSMFPACKQITVSFSKRPCTALLAVPSLLNSLCKHKLL